MNVALRTVPACNAEREARERLYAACLAIYRLHGFTGLREAAEGACKRVSDENRADVLAEGWIA